MHLEDLRIFVRVAELASFTQAADQLGLMKGRVSASVQQLEAQVGTRLLQRTTRRVRLTSDGEQFLDRARQLLADAEQLQSMFQPAASGLRGRLRIDLPNTLARELVIPRLPEFLAAHPLLEVAISTTDRFVDLVQEGFDCVVRVGALADSELIVRPLGQMDMANVASPAYIEAHGMPQTLDDLARHRIVHYSGALRTHGAGLEYMEGGEHRLHPMRTALVVNSADAFQAACVAGLGIIQAPRRGVRALIDAGQLVELLPAFAAQPLPVSLLYPHREHVPPRVQAMLAWLVQVVEPALQPVVAGS
ncbi:MAG: LysR family transcriptional regulator [Pseudacidovorax sp.]|nr:LysR family transcriptional regulator [Pseudacidovorax sp.]